MSDIVDYLRYSGEIAIDEARKAADGIERLREAVRVKDAENADLKNALDICHRACEGWQKIASAAVAGKGVGK